MASQDDFFTPEEVDEQLEAIERTGQAGMQDLRLIEALSSVLPASQVSATHLDESHERILARVFSRLLSAEETLRIEEADLPPVLPRNSMPGNGRYRTPRAKHSQIGKNTILSRGNRAQGKGMLSLPSQQISNDAHALQESAYPHHKKERFFRTKERHMITNQPNVDDSEQEPSPLFAQKLALRPSQVGRLPRRKAPIWSRVAAVLVAVLLVVLLIGTLQLTRQHPATSTQIAHRGSTNVFQGGPYLIQARDNGDGLSIPNPDATILIPSVSLAPSWSYEVTMTQVHESATPQYGSSYGLILAKTKEKAYALTFRDERGKSVALLYNYEFLQYDSPSYVNTPVPITLAWNTSNLASFHTGLNVANTVRITETAHTLTIMVNGELVGTVNFTLGSGQFGMFVMTKGTAVRFQNVQIKQL